MNPRAPIYIPTKGRYDDKGFISTFRSLERLRVPFRAVVEEQEKEQYEARLGAERVLILDPDYKRQYEKLDEHGLDKSTGPGPARNFIWDHAISEGHAWHWVMDDNIEGFLRLHKNKRVLAGDGTLLRCMEDFCDRYENLAMAGPNYYMFVPDKYKHNPICFNTRIYSCNLIRNDVPFRWRGRYNEDTILSLDMLKAGWCTVQFNAFLQRKLTTQVAKGGNSDEFYFKEGTLPKSEMLVKAHPDVSRVVWRYGRWHHHVNYRVFRGNKLRFRPGHEPKDAVNEYGLRLIR